MQVFEVKSWYIREDLGIAYLDFFYKEDTVMPENNQKHKYNTKENSKVTVARTDTFTN